MRAQYKFLLSVLLLGAFQSAHAGLFEDIKDYWAQRPFKKGYQAVELYTNSDEDIQLYQNLINAIDRQKYKNCESVMKADGSLGLFQMRNNLRSEINLRIFDPRIPEHTNTRGKWINDYGIFEKNTKDGHHFKITSRSGGPFLSNLFIDMDKTATVVNKLVRVDCSLRSGASLTAENAETNCQVQSVCYSNGSR